MSSHLSILSARVRALIISPGGSGDDAFNELALQIFHFQFAHNAPYRKLCEACKVSPLQLERWSRIPSVPTSAFKDFELSCLAPGERTMTFHSSGTTGHRPGRHFHNSESLELYELSLLRWFEHCVGASPEARSNRSRRLVILTPPPRQASHSSLVHMFDSIRRSWGISESAFVAKATNEGAWELSLARTVELLRSVSKLGQPVTIFGTAFSFVHLLDYLAEQKVELSLPPDSQALETGGYKGRSRVVPKAELHRLMCSRLGLEPGKIICEYGMSELSSQAYEQQVGDGLELTRRFLFPPWTRVRVISPENGREVGEGEMGLIRVLDLANIASVVAVQTEDLGLKRGCGFELIGRAEASERRGCSLMPAVS